MIGHVIHCSGQGIKTLWTDEIDLASLGDLKVTRASNIEFVDQIGLWEVRIPDRKGDREGYQVAFTNPSRAACLAWERDHFNELLRQS